MVQKAWKPLPENHKLLFCSHGDWGSCGNVGMVPAAPQFPVHGNARWRRWQSSWQGQRFAPIRTWGQHQEDWVCQPCDKKDGNSSSDPCWKEESPEIADWKPWQADRWPHQEADQLLWPGNKGQCRESKSHGRRCVGIILPRTDDDPHHERCPAGRHS